MELLVSFIQAKGLANSWDVAALIFLTIVAVIYGLFVGRDRMVMNLVSTYIALAIVTNAPVLSILTNALRIGPSAVWNVAWFLILFLICLLLLWRSRILRSLSLNKGVWWETALFSLLQVGLLASSILFLMPSFMLKNMNSLTQALFVGTAARSFWVLTPLIPLAFLAKNSSSSQEYEVD